MAKVAKEIKKQTTKPSRVRIVISLSLSVIIVILSGILMISLIPPDCEKIRTAAAKDFEAGNYESASQKLQPYVKPCAETNSRDSTLRYKFYDGIATADYTFGHASKGDKQKQAIAKQAAVRYASEAQNLWNHMSLSQQGAVQRQAADIEDISVGEYYYFKGMN